MKPLHTIYRARAALLRRRIEREHSCRVVPMIGPVHYEQGMQWAADVRKHDGRPLHIVMQTYGGMDAAMRIVAHALRSAGPVTVHVPRFAYSAGTGVAINADTIVMGLDAQLGQTDSIIKAGATERATLTLAAYALGEDVSLTHASRAVSDARAYVLATRMARGDDEATADRVAAALTSGEWGEHWRPIFADDAAAMGLPIVCRDEPLYAELARLVWASLEQTE